MVVRGLSVLLFVLVLGIGCRSRKAEAPVPVVQQSPAPATAVTDPLSPDSLYNAMLASNATLQWFSARASIDATIDKETKSFQANVRIRTDSAIWMSISPALGIEVAKVLITRDSVRFINRLNSSFFEGDYGYLKNMLQVDLNFNMIQAVLTGNAYLHYPVDKYIRDSENGDWILSTFKKRRMRREQDLELPQILSQEIWFSPLYQKITRMEMQDYKPVRKFSVNYLNFETIDGIKVPRSFQFTASAQKVVNVRMEYSKQTVNKVLNLPFSIPEGYERMH